MRVDQRQTEFGPCAGEDRKKDDHTPELETADTKVVGDPEILFFRAVFSIISSRVSTTLDSVSA